MLSQPLLYADMESLMDKSLESTFAAVDPTKLAVLHQKVNHCSIGKTPSAFFKVRADLALPDLIKLIGYDPRTITPKAKAPANISEGLEQLISEVQRTIDQGRVQEMVEYLRDAVENEGYADWAEIDIVTVAQPDTTNWQVEHYVAFPQAAEYFITDGQHRYCAILDFVRQYPELANRFTVAIAIGVLPKDRLTEWAGQSFHDKNYLQKLVKATKALSVDARDLHNRLAKDLHEHPLIRKAGGINTVKDSLSSGAAEFTTHSLLYKFVRGFTEGHRGVFKGTIQSPMLTEQSYEELKKNISDYLTMLGQVFPDWTLHPDREQYLFRASAALQALGALGYLLWNKVDDVETRKKLIGNIGEKSLDWRRTNWGEWGPVMGRVVEGESGKYVSPSSTRQIIEGSIAFLRKKSGINQLLTDESEGG
jgi:DGQHR domain-containing protein